MGAEHDNPTLRALCAGHLKDWVKCWTSICQKQFKSSCSQKGPGCTGGLTPPSPAPSDTVIQMKSTHENMLSRWHKCSCGWNIQCYFWSISKFKCSHEEQERGREHSGLTSDCRLSSFNKQNNISCNTFSCHWHLMPLSMGHL